MARLAKKLPIASLATSPPFDLHAKRAHHWLSLRVGAARRYCALYPNGRALATGCRSIEEATACFRELWSMLPPEVRDAQISDVVIQNIVAVGDLNHEVVLDQVVLARPEVIEFEPEQFPGAILTTGIRKAKALLFQSGKFVLTGAKTFAELDAAEAVVRELVKEIT